MNADIQHKTYYAVEKEAGFGTYVKSIASDEDLGKMEKVYKKELLKNDGFSPKLIKVEITTIREETFLK